MTRGLLIPALPFLPITERPFNGLADYQSAVRGYIEPVSIARPSLTLYVNEEAKLQNLEVNPRATALWWLHEPAVRGQDIISGPAVVIADEADDEAGRLLGLLPLERPFKVEICTADARLDWQPAQQLFSDWFDAAINALRLEAMWDAVRDIRVIAA